MGAQNFDDIWPILRLALHRGWTHRTTGTPSTSNATLVLPAKLRTPTIGSISLSKVRSIATVSPAMPWSKNRHDALGTSAAIAVEYACEPMG